MCIFEWNFGLTHYIEPHVNTLADARDTNVPLST